MANELQGPEPKMDPTTLYREEVNVLQGIPDANRIWITAKDTKADLEVFVDNEIKRRQYGRPISSNEAVLNSIRYEILNKADGM